jgi:hypothetical protein
VDAGIVMDQSLSVSEVDVGQVLQSLRAEQTGTRVHPLLASERSAFNKIRPSVPVAPGFFLPDQTFQAARVSAAQLNDMFRLPKSPS